MFTVKGRPFDTWVLPCADIFIPFGERKRPFHLHLNTLKGLHPSAMGNTHRYKSDDDHLDFQPNQKRNQKNKNIFHCANTLRSSPQPLYQQTK